MINIVISAADWLSGAWQTITGAFASAWMWIKDLFTGVWDFIGRKFAAVWTRVSDLFAGVREGIKGVVMGFVEWLQPVIDLIIAPFKAIGSVISGIINTAGGWFSDTVDKGNAKLAEMAENKMKAATASPAETSTTTGASLAKAPAFTTASAVSSPALGGAVSGGGNSLAAEHLAAASRKGIAGTAGTAASDAFMSGGGALADFDRDAQQTFSAATQPQKAAVVQAPWNAPETKPEKRERPHFTVQNLTLQCDDIKKVYDMYEQFEMIFMRPEAV